MRLSRINSTLPLGESSKFASIENSAPLFRKDNYGEKERVLRRTQETLSGRLGVPDLNVLDYRKMAQAECGEKLRGHKEEVEKSSLHLARLNSSWTTRRGGVRMKMNDNKRSDTRGYGKEIRENSKGEG